MCSKSNLQKNPGQQLGFFVSIGNVTFNTCEEPDS